MPPVILAAAAAATLVFAYRLIKQSEARAALRQKAAARQSRPVETLVRDPETGIYRPASAPKSSI